MDSLYFIRLYGIFINLDMVQLYLTDESLANYKTIKQQSLVCL